jgi:hypothetical protein
MPTYTVTGLREEHVEVEFEAANLTEAQARVDELHQQLDLSKGCTIKVLSVLPEVYGVSPEDVTEKIEERPKEPVKPYKYTYNFGVDFCYPTDTDPEEAGEKQIQEELKAWVKDVVKRGIFRIADYTVDKDDEA